MKCSITSILVLSLMTVICPTSVSETLNVPGDFRTIQLAIDAAKTGDTIVVASGEYREDIEIKKGIDLQGAGIDATKLIGAIVVEGASDVTIDGFTVEGQGRDAHFGIWCSASTLTISNNAIVGYHHGIGSELSRMIIENNSVLRNFNVGIQITAAAATLIKGNTVADNVDTGIRIALSEDNVLMTDNIITRNRVGIDCIQSAPRFRRNVIEENQIGVQTTQEDIPDLGTDDDPGFNVIRDNGLHIINMEPRRAIQAKGNYWGNTTSPVASSFEGKVDYTPWLETDPLKGQPVEPQGRLATTWGRIRRDGCFL